MKNNTMVRASGFITAFAVILCFIFSCTGMTVFETSAAAPSITLASGSAGVGEEIVVHYSGTGSRDWIGIYAEGTAPSHTTPSLRWCYAENGSGSVSLIAQSEVNAKVQLPPGKYRIYLCRNNGYTVLDREDFTITSTYESAEDVMPSISFGSGRTINIKPAKKYNAQISYELYLGTASGRLPGYTSLGTVSLKNNRYSYTLNTRTVIPSEATHVYAYICVGGVEIPYFSSARIPESSFYNSPSPGNKLYEFQIFTDIHITEDPAHIHNRHFEQALRDVLQNSPDSKGIITIGDNTDQGRETQWKNLVSIQKSVLKDGKPTLYFTMGNHDRDYNGSFDAQVNLFKKYTGMPGIYYSFKIENNTFIVLGSEQKGGFANLSTTQRNWLKTQLEQASSEEAVFVFLHEPMKNTVSGSLSYLNPTIQDWYGVLQDAQLRSIIDPHPNVMMFTGHTHWHFNTTQPMLYGGGKTANYFNAASVGYLWNDEDAGVVGSQGYYVEVFQNGIFVRGRDFANGLWTPATQYFIPLGSIAPTPTPGTPTAKPTGTAGRTPTAGAASPTPTATAAVTGTAPVTAPDTTATPATGTASPMHTAATARPSSAPASTQPEERSGGSAALVVTAALLSAAAIAAAVVAGIVLYKAKHV